MEKERNNRRTRRKFSEEYKAEAVRMVSEGRRTKSEVAASLGISAALLSRWYAVAKSGSHGDHVASSLNDSERIRQLEREVQDLKLERELLKKPRHTLPRTRRKVCVYGGAPSGVLSASHVESARGKYLWVLPVEKRREKSKKIL